MCTSTIASALRASETGKEIAARCHKLQYDSVIWAYQLAPGERSMSEGAETSRCHKCGRVNSRDLVAVGRYRRSELRRH
jgi:hypothetical protein